MKKGGFIGFLVLVAVGFGGSLAQARERLIYDAPRYAVAHACADGVYLKLNRDPYDPRKPPSPNEEIVALPEDACLPILGGHGASTGLVPKGTLVVRDRRTKKIVRIYECGNDLLATVYLREEFPEEPRYIPPPPTIVERNFEEEYRGSRQSFLTGYRSEKPCYPLVAVVDAAAVGVPGYLVGKKTVNASTGILVGAVYVGIRLLMDDTNPWCVAGAATAGYFGGKALGKHKREKDEANAVLAPPPYVPPQGTPPPQPPEIGPAPPAPN